MNTTSNSFSSHDGEIENSKNRKDSSNSSSSLSDHCNESVNPIPLMETDRILKNDTAGKEPQTKRNRLDELFPPPNAQPGPQLHIQEASISEDHEDSFKSNDAAPDPVLAPTKKKNPNLNITIPPLSSNGSLGPSSSGLDGDEALVTPLSQMVHTPTTAPGAPAPVDPSEARRLEKFRTNLTTHVNGYSPAVLSLPLDASEDLNSHGFHQFSGQELSHEPSTAALNMYALTTSRSPTFAPDPFSLRFGNDEQGPETGNRGGHPQ